MVIPNLDLPVFSSGLKSNLDWQAWERISREKGAFLYSDKQLLRHRVHEDSETTLLINNDIRGAEDLFMFEQFWPRPIARLLNSRYSKSLESNQQ